MERPWGPRLSLVGSDLGPETVPRSRAALPARPAWVSGTGNLHPVRLFHFLAYQTWKVFFVAKTDIRTSAVFLDQKLVFSYLPCLVAMSGRGPASRLAIHKLAWVFKTFEPFVCVTWFGYEDGVQFRTIWGLICPRI